MVESMIKVIVAFRLRTFRPFVRVMSRALLQPEGQVPDGHGVAHTEIAAPPATGAPGSQADRSIEFVAANSGATR